MSAVPLHDWNLTPAEARSLQSRLADRVDDRTKLEVPAIRRVVAVDVSMNRFSSWLAAAAVVCDIAAGQVVEESVVIRPIRFPYVPGLLSFREAPAILEAVSALRSPFDAVVVDGQGLAHHRGLGIASHLGLWLDMPTVGLAKSRLCGSHEPVPERQGAAVALYVGDKAVGSVWRSRARALPIYVSVGHKCRSDEALELAKRLSDGRRIPWPIRAAHDVANRARRDHLSKLAAAGPTSE
jgi:deoxyribonuclease V